MSTIRERVSPEEWQVRLDLAAAYRLVADFGWTDLVFTHISARVPGPEHHFLINPYGMLFEEITASSLVKIDKDANILLDTGYPVNPAGFTIHSAVHEAREDAKAVLHLHTPDGTAVSTLEQGLLPLNQTAQLVMGELAYHDYEGVALNDEEKPRLVRDFGDKQFLMLRNHGLLTVGESAADAFIKMYFFETACRIQLQAQSGGSELIEIDPRIIAGARAQAKTATKSAGGELAWPGLLRKLDRIDPSFRD